MDTLNEDNLTGVNHGGFKSNVPLRWLAASSLIGDKVRNRQDEHLGEIKDIMIDIITGKIEYFVIEFGGFLGVGGHLVAVPYDSIIIDDTGQKITLPGASKDELKKLSQFNYPAS